MNIGSIGLNAMDITIIILTLMMALKGLLSGFLKELFGFLGLIGGIYVASRFASVIANYIDANLLHMENYALIKLIGFLGILAAIWGLSVFISSIAIGVSKTTPHSSLDRVFGFIVAGVKYFLIFSLIVAALLRSPLIKDSMAKVISGSRLYPTLDMVGSTLINFTPTDGKIKITNKTK